MISHPLGGLISRPLGGLIPRPLGAVIFDMDGLLLDSEVLARQAAIEACAAVGHEMTDEIFLSLIGNPGDVINAQLLSHYGPHFPLKDFSASMWSNYDRLCHPAIAVKAGAVELLDHLIERNIPRAVATSTGRLRAAEKLQGAGILQRLDVLVARDDVTRGKPFPDTYLKAAEQLGVDPKSCLALEDSYNGVRAAHAAGMATIMVPDLLAPKPDITELCIAVMGSLSEVAISLRP